MTAAVCVKYCLLANIHLKLVVVVRSKLPPHLWFEMMWFLRGMPNLRVFCRFIDTQLFTRRRRNTENSFRNNRSVRSVACIIMRTEFSASYERISIAGASLSHCQQVRCSANVNRCIAKPLSTGASLSRCQQVRRWATVNRCFLWVACAQRGSLDFIYFIFLPKRRLLFADRTYFYV